MTEQDKIEAIEKFLNKQLKGVDKETLRQYDNGELEHMAQAGPDGWKHELLDWVSACQSAYHIDNTPGHRFGGLGSNLEENRAAVVEYVEELLTYSAAQVQSKQTYAADAAMDGM